MTIEIGDAFRYFMYFVLVFAIPFLCFELGIMLYRVNSILKDTKVVSKSVAEATGDEEKLKGFIEDVVSGSTNAIIDTQTKSLFDGVTKAITAFKR